MVTVVTGKNQVTIPVQVANAAGIHRGSQLEWSFDTKRKQLCLKVLPGRGELARRLLGAGRKYLKPGDDPVAELIAGREQDDRERSDSLERP